MIGQVISHYRVVDVIGEGGMGTVYVAEDMILKRRTAIKILRLFPGKHNYRARFLREAQSASALNHPNIAAVYEFGETDDGTPFLVMELIEGHTLKDLLQSGSLTLERALEIIEGVGCALAEAHRHGIIHRDIKPANVAINGRGDVKVLDFGLAKQLNGTTSVTGNIDDSEAAVATQTCENVALGTPMYSSPEQALGMAVDPRSDLFSLGAMLYECITGSPAFPGRTAAEVRAKVIRDEPTTPSRVNPSIPRTLDRIALKALAKNVDDRYQSTEELLADLRLIRSSLSVAEPLIIRPVPDKVEVTHPSILTSLSDRLRRPSSMIGVFVATLILALLAAWVAMSWARHRTAPVSPEAVGWYNEGVNALRDGTYNKATKALQKAVAIEDNFPLAHARLAEALTELEYTDLAKNELLRVALTQSARSDLSSLETLYLRAINLSLTGDSKGAIATYLKIVEQLPEGERAAAYVDLGRAYERDGDFKKAMQSYSEALKIDPQHSAAAIRIGVLYGKRQGKQNIETALASFKIAETRYQTLSNVEGLAEVFYQRGAMYVTQRKLDEAKIELTQALAKAEAIDDNKYQQFKTRMQLSSVLCLGGDSEGAEHYATEALNFAQANALENSMANGLITLGNAFLVRTNLSQAQIYLDRAVEVAQRFKTRRSEARALLSLASIASQHHDKPTEVRRYVERALSLYQQEGSRKYSMQAAALLGHAADQQGDYSSAIQAFDQQLQLATELDDQEQIALADEGIGIVLYHQEDYARALERFEQAYAITKSLKMIANEIHVLVSKGRVLWQLGLYSDAQRVLTEALKTATEQENPDEELIARIHLVQSQQALSQGEFEVAINESRKALELAQREFELVTLEAQYTLSLAQAQSGEMRGAEQQCAAAVEAARKIENPRTMSAALLALATVRMKARDWHGAVAAASEAEGRFKAAQQLDSEWRTLLIAASASKHLGDTKTAQSYAALAVESFHRFQDRLTPDANRSYLARTDVNELREQLKREFAINS